MLYANMKPCFNTIPPSFTTIVFNYLITINVELLSLLGIPITGAEVMDVSDFHTIGFNEIAIIRQYTRDTGRVYPNFVLRKVDAIVGGHRPRVNAPGGATQGDHVASTSGIKEEVDEDDKLEGINDDAGISDYMSSPTYPF
ncbi:unnamed protein product [Linum trigynum]|uniref:Uncharacterized protein n=1 Tax=Linum trigynum TaxID=586398 RepID=A0AAV2FU42_9ROSI